MSGYPAVYHAQDVIQRKVRKFIALFKQLFSIKTLQSKVGRRPALSPIESVLYGVLKQKRTIQTQIAAYDDFGLARRCSDKTFVVSLNRWSWLAALFVSLILKAHRNFQHPITHIDSTVIPVGRLTNAKRHKTMNGIAFKPWTANGRGFVCPRFERE